MHHWLLKYSLFIVILIWPSLPICQSIEKLTVSFHASTNNSQKAVLANKLGNIYTFENPDSSLYYYQVAENLSQANNLDSLQLRSLLGKVTAYTHLYQYAIAIQELRKGKKLNDQFNQPYYEGQYLNRMGQCFSFQQEYDSAIHYILKFDDLLVLKNLEHQRWRSHIHLSTIYINQKDIQKALESLYKALDYVRIKKNSMDYLFVLLEVIRYEKQLEHFEAVSDLTEEYLDFKLNKQGSSIEEILKISQHVAMRSPGMNEDDLEKSLLNYIPYHASLKNWLALCTGCFNLGNIYLDQGQSLKAIQVFKQGLIGADSLRSIAHQSNFHRGLYRSYKASKMFDKALEHHEIVGSLAREIQNQDRQKQMRDYRVKYETAQKEIELNKANFELNEVKQKQQFMWLGLFSLATLLGLSFYAYRNKKNLGKLLSEKNQVITKALKEKDILLKEIHHRVKNNLQMVSALLYLQGKSIEDETAKDAIKESENRVQSMAMIHQKLYQDENLLGVDVKDYLDRLFDHLFDSYNIDGQRISLVKSIELQNMDIDTVIPLALIVNELVSNALKYAFQDGRSGEIKVILKEQADHIILKVEDNGIGLPAGFDKDKTINFGYKLINILSGKLGGTWTLNNEKGTSINFEFPKAA